MPIHEHGAIPAPCHRKRTSITSAATEPGINVHLLEQGCPSNHHFSAYYLVASQGNMKCRQQRLVESDEGGNQEYVRD